MLESLSVGLGNDQARITLALGPVQRERDLLPAAAHWGFAPAADCPRGGAASAWFSTAGPVEFVAGAGVCGAGAGVGFGTYILNCAPAMSTPQPRETRIERSDPMLPR